MTIAITDRVCLIGGHFSREGQALSSSQLYNLGLETDQNIIIKPLGGAYKRPGTIFAIASSKIQRFYPYSYEPGRVAVSIIATEGIVFADLDLGLYTEQFRPPTWQSEDVERVKIYTFESVLYIYLPKFDDYVRPRGIFYKIRLELSQDESILRVIGEGPLDFVSPPYAPILPARGIRFITVDENDTKASVYLDRPEQADIGVITIGDVGRTINVFATIQSQKLPERDVGREEWAEYEITAVADDGHITLAHVAGATIKDAGYSTRQWFISAFTTSGTRGGRMGAPADMCVHQGRLWLVKDSVVIASRLDVDPLDFSFVVGDESSAICKLTPTSIYWAISSMQLIIGCSDGIYVMGSSVQGGGIQEKSIGLIRLYNIAPSRLKPVQHSDGIIFVGSDGRKIYKIEPNEQNFFRIGQINTYAEDLTLGGIVAHAMQFSPYKIYWAVTAAGKLLSCVFADSEPLHRWTYHELGGAEPYVLDVTTARQNNRDVVLMLVRRIVNGAPVYSIDYISKFFDGYVDDPYAQIFLDSCISFQQETNIKRLYSGTDLHCTVRGDDEYPVWFYNMLDRERGNLQLQFLDVYGADPGVRTHIKYDPSGLQYYGLSRKGFSIDCNSADERLERRHTLQRWEGGAWYPLFGAAMFVESIANVDGGAFGRELVEVTFRDEVDVAIVVSQLLVSFYGMMDVAKNADERLVLEEVFGLQPVDRKRFRLTQGGRLVNVAIKDDKAFREEVLSLVVYVGYRSVGFMLSTDEQELPRVDLETYYPPMDGDDSIERNFRFDLIPGAVQYTGQRVRLLRNLRPYPPIIPGESPPIQYFIRRYPEHYLPVRRNTVTDDKQVFFQRITVVPKTNNVGVYQPSAGVVGRGNWQIARLSRRQLRHLVDAEIDIAWNGGVLSKEDLLLDDSKFSDPGQDDDHRFYTIVTLEPAFTIAAGYRYTVKISPVPLIVPSPFGSGEGASGQQRVCMLKLQDSAGGTYAADEDEELNARYKIPYKDRATEEPAETGGLFSGMLTVKIEQQQDPTRRTIYIEQSEPVNFTLLNIIQDVNIVDK
jgi:hypothetical protein